MARMQVLDFQQDGFQLRACVVFRLNKEPHPHVVCMVVDDEQAIVEAMWGGDINLTPKVRGHVQEGRDGFSQAMVLWGAVVALWSKHESQETLFTKLA
jgi:hypothetical protein